MKKNCDKKRKYLFLCFIFSFFLLIGISFINSLEIGKTKITGVDVTKTIGGNNIYYYNTTSINETDPIWTGNYSIFAGLINNASYLSTFNSTYEGCINNESYLSTYNSTYAGLINNASYLSTYNATYDANIGNSSWNQSIANTLYADIKWGYNMTTAAYDLYNIIWSSTYNLTYAGLINNASYLSTYNSTYEGCINNASYLSTYNSTYDGLVNNASYLTTGNSSYLLLSGGVMTGNLNMSSANVNITINDSSFICLNQACSRWIKSNTSGTFIQG